MKSLSFIICGTPWKAKALLLILFASIFTVMLPISTLGSEYPEIVFVGKVHEILELQSCEWISGLTCKITYNGKLPYPKELLYSTYDSNGQIMKKDKSMRWWSPEKLEKGETGIFTFQDYGYQDPSRIEIMGIWE